MSQTKKKLPDFEPDADYRVTLNRVAKVGSLVLRPSADEITVKGHVAAKIATAIETSEKV